MYQLAVKHHLGCTDQILQSILAIPYHYSATDENAAIAHGKCPLGAKSWCKYQAAVAQGVEPPKHPNFLGPEAVKLVKEVFDRYNYDKPFFIEQIADGQTSNHNEALHNILFTMVPKSNAISYNTMLLGSALAVIRYNGGFSDLFQAFDILGIERGAAVEELFAELDNKRVQRGYTTKERMLQRFLDRQARSSKESRKIKKHGAGYCSGKFAGSAVRPTPCSIEELEDEDPEVNPIHPDPQGLDVDVNIPLATCGVCEELELGSDDDTDDVPVGKLKWIQ